MKRETFNRQFAALANAYLTAQKLAEETQDVYWQMLQDIPDERFVQGVQLCLARCKFFPTISELGEASLPTKMLRVPYNPYVYIEPIKVDWREQLDRLKLEPKQIPESVRKMLPGIVKEKKKR
jgi:hypothetical protein